MEAKEMVEILGLSMTIIGGVATVSAYIYYKWHTSALSNLTVDRDAWRDRSTTLEGERDRGTLLVTQSREKISNLEGRIDIMQEILQGKDPASLEVQKKLADAISQISITFAAHTREDIEKFGAINKTMERTANILERNVNVLEHIERHLSLKHDE